MTGTKRASAWKKTALICAKKQWAINILQWNAGGLSPTKVTELMKELVKHEIDIFIINKANISPQNE
jgi:hypothetical protein